MKDIKQKIFYLLSGALGFIAGIASQNIASFWIFYQPKVPKSLRKDDKHV